MKIRMIVCFAYGAVLFLCVSSVCLGQAGRSKSTKPEVRKPASQNPKNAQLDIEAGLIFKSGDVKPVGRAEMMILKSDPRTILRTDQMFNLWRSDISGGRAAGISFTDWSFYWAAISIDAEIYPKYAAAAKKLLSENRIASITTGFDGKATLGGVPMGSHFIFASYEFGNEHVVWGVPITIKAGRNKVILDNNNMN